MGIFREIPPTAGLPLHFREILSIFRFPGESLEDDFKQYLNVNYARVTYSGTAAFYLILESLKELSKKKTVIIPAFICPLLPLAIKRAGLMVEVCDINKDNFKLNFEQLEKLCCASDDILAIVPAHLGGIPLEFEPLKKIAETHKIFIIEDCAQSLGAEYKGTKVGTLGDFGFFSLCRGKGLTIYEGGLIITAKEEYALQIDKTIARLVKGDYFSEGLKILELFGYWIFYRPVLFWFIFRLPQIFWELRGNSCKANIEYFEVNFPIHRVSGIRKAIGHAGFYRVEKEIYKQREKVDGYLKRLEGIQGVRVLREPAQSKATYPYLTLIFSDAEKRKVAARLFENSGLGASQIYAVPITGYDYLKEIIPDRIFPGAEYMAAHEITLSTSTFLNQKDLDRIADIIQKL